MNDGLGAAGAAGHTGGSGGGGGSSGAAGIGGSSGDPSEPAGTTTTSFEGTWLATTSPAQLLRYPKGASSPADVIELAEDDVEYLEIVDGVAFYLADFIATYGEVVYVQDLRTGARSEIAFSPESALAGLVFADGSLWVGDEALDVVWRLNPATKEIVGGTRLENNNDDFNDSLELAASADSVYVSSLFAHDAVLRIATSSGEVVARQEEAGDGTTGVAVGEGAAWATSRFDGSLWHLNADDLTFRRSIALDAEISDMTRNVVAAFGDVWVLAGEGGNAQDIFGRAARPGVFIVDAASDQPLAHVPIDAPAGLRASDDALWVTGASAAHRIDPATRSVTQTLAPVSGEVVEIAFARTGGGTGSTEGLTPIDVFSIVEPPPMVCDDLNPFYNHGTAPLLDPASATLTQEGGVTTFDQGVCHAIHNAQGEVVEYIAFFADAIDDPTKYLRLTVPDYAGDGTYAADLDWETETDSDYVSATAIISEGGMHAVVTADASGDALELDCPASADVDLEPQPLPTPQPGEVVVQLDDGRVLRFINMDCGADLLSDTLSVTAPDYFVSEGDEPYAFKLTTNDPAEEGTIEGIVWFTYYGRTFWIVSAEVVLTCGSPVTGTFSAEGVTGSFTCR